MNACEGWKVPERATTPTNPPAELEGSFRNLYKLNNASDHLMGLEDTTYTISEATDSL